MGKFSNARRILGHLYRTRSRRIRLTMRDRRLANRLRNAFERDLELSGLKGLHFYTVNGVVTVYGAVRHDLDRDLLVGFIQQIQGVRGVVEHLRVEPPVAVREEPVDEGATNA